MPYVQFSDCSHRPSFYDIIIEGIAGSWMICNSHPSYSANKRVRKTFHQSIIFYAWSSCASHCVPWNRNHNRVKIEWVRNKNPSFSWRLIIIETICPNSAPRKWAHPSWILPCCNSGLLLRITRLLQSKRPGCQRMNPQRTLDSQPESEESFLGC